MATLDASFKFFWSLIRIKPTITDNAVFKLYYRFTTPVILVLCVLVWCKQFFGEPIHCVGPEISKELLDTYCWIHSTFTVPGMRQKPYDVVYDGVTFTTGEDIVYHAYYQWVFLFLLFQAACFFAPYYVWISFEAGKMESLLLGLNKPVAEDEADRHKKVQLLARYLYKSLGQHKTYCGIYCFCELLNFANVAAQIYLTDVFLGGEFTTYGFQVLDFSLGMNQMNRTDPMIRVFPRMTKCAFYSHGVSGSVQTHDALCVLPINIINDKIFMFLWIWFIFLAALGAIVLIYRTLLLIFKKLRLKVTFSRNQFVERSDLQKVITRCDCGSWFLLDLLCRNITTMNFVDVVHEYAILIDEAFALKETSCKLLGRKSEKEI